MYPKLYHVLIFVTMLYSPFNPILPYFSPTTATPTRRSLRWSGLVSCCPAQRTAPAVCTASWWSAGMRSPPAGLPSQVHILRGLPQPYVQPHGGVLEWGPRPPAYLHRYIFIRDSPRRMFIVCLHCIAHWYSLMAVQSHRFHCIHRCF